MRHLYQSLQTPPPSALRKTQRVASSCTISVPVFRDGEIAESHHAVDHLDLGHLIEDYGESNPDASQTESGYQNLLPCLENRVIVPLAYVELLTYLRK